MVSFNVYRYPCEEVPSNIWTILGYMQVKIDLLPDKNYRFVIITSLQCFTGFVSPKFKN